MTQFSHARSGHEPFEILIVDDQELLRDVVGEYLTTQGYRVRAVDCGDAGLQLLKAGLRPDLLLSDVMLPDRRGKELMREAHGLVPGLKVLFMSGHFRENLEAELGDAEFLQKPFRLDVLAHRVRSLIQRGKSH